MGRGATANHWKSRDAQPGGAHRDESDGLDRLVGLRWAGLKLPDDPLPILLPGGDSFGFGLQFNRLLLKSTRRPLTLTDAPSHQRGIRRYSGNFAGCAADILNVIISPNG